MNQMTTGASNDFERATQIARDIVTRYGMTDSLGPMVYAENDTDPFLGRQMSRSSQMSEATMQKVDAEIRAIIDEQYHVARKLIEDNKDKMHAMAKALMEWETIDAEQVEDIMQGRPPRPPKVPDQPYDSQPPSAGNAPQTDKADEQKEAEDSSKSAKDKKDKKDKKDEDGDKPVEAL